MANITIDATSVSGAVATETTSPVAWDHICSGEERLLIVMISHYSSSNALSVTGITYNGVPLTKVRKDTVTDASERWNTEIWFLVAPDTGTNSISVTFSATSNLVMGGAGLSVNGANQDIAQVLDAQDTGQGTADTSLSVDHTISKGGSIVVDALCCMRDPSVAGGDQTTLLDIVASGEAEPTQHFAASRQTTFPNVPGRTVIENWTIGTGDFWVMSTASFEDSDPHESRVQKNILRPAIFTPGRAR